MVRKRFKLTGKRFVTAENAAGVVYGVITVGALMAAESGRHESHLDSLASALFATLLYWLAHAYADLLGNRLETGERLTAAALGRALVHDWAIVRGAAVPMLALVIAWLVGASREAGVTAALRTAVVTVVVFELLAGIRAKSTPGELLLKGAVGVTMGLAILAVKGVLR
ncbi:MAG TPA: hypothetical protein VK761_06685 [Solirubrobacteraceae bacterium]|jgi:hypothetical protein|nr:hypothetical protein [Solirubrobacteraceae bacterium]